MSNSFLLPNKIKRYAIGKIFHFLTFFSVFLCLFFLVLLLGRMVQQGMNAFYHYQISLPITFDLSKTDIVNPESPSAEDLKTASYSPLLQDALLEDFSFLTSKHNKREFFDFLSPESPFYLQKVLQKHPEYIGKKVTVSFEIATHIENYFKYYRSAIIWNEFNTPLINNINPLHKFQSHKGVRLFTANNIFSTYFKDVPCVENIISNGVSQESQICHFDENDPSFFIKQGNLLAKIIRVVFKPSGEELFYTKNYSLKDVDFVHQTKKWHVLRYNTPEKNRQISDFSIMISEAFYSKGIIKSQFPNFPFFFNADSRNPEQAGILGALTGSILTVLICLFTALPIGVAAAVYLEEFAPQNALTEFFEVNINNLASVPSIIYGLLGLSFLLNVIHLPRSTPIVGGVVLGMMSLPIIIIATRTALRTVPQTLRDAALALGATKVQTFFHHVLPSALPGIMTGSVLAVSRAVGETAPLLLIGMVAFISNIPSGFSDFSTVLPVQIFLWSENPEIGFVEKTAAAILILVTLMLFLNWIAIIIRHRFERKY